MYSEVDESIRAKLPLGEWMDEPDYQHWIDEETGLDCLILRGELGHLCGYVGIPRDHYLYGYDYGDCTLSSARLRNPEELKEAVRFMDGIDDPENGVYLQPWPEGRLRDLTVERETNRLICDEDHCNHTLEYIIRVHGGVTYSGEGNEKITKKTGDNNLYWIGFDCAHYDDLTPIYRFNGTYKNITYVMEQCRSLAQQLKEFEISKGNDIRNG